MERLRESIRNNPLALRQCIQYEVLRKKPIFESYQNFCKTVGNDVMNFPDFEFWFVRFCMGEVELDYDRSQNPKPLEFSELPVELVSKILKKLNPVDRIVTRYVSKSLRNCVDGLTPNIERIDIQFTWDKMILRFDSKELAFNKVDNKCEVVLNGDKFIFKNQNYMRVALNELKAVLNNSILENFEVNVEGGVNINEIRKVSEEFENQFSAKNFKNSSILVECPLCIVLKSGTLINFYHNYTGRSYYVDKNFIKISKTEQWRNAKIVEYKTRGGVEPKELHRFLDHEEFVANLCYFPKYAMDSLMKHARIHFSPDSWALVPLNNKFVVYEKSKNGCVVKFNNSSTQRVEIKTDNFMKVAMNDIMMSLNKPNNPLKHLEIDINGVRIDELIEGLSDISDEFSSRFNVKSLFSKCTTESIPILRIVKPGVLERIQLVYLGDFAAFNTIVGTEQWKQAKVAQFIGLIGLPSTQLRKFYHFDDFTVLLVDFDIGAFAGLIKSSFSKLASGSFVKHEVVSLLPINFVQMTGHQQILADTRENITYHLRASFGAHFVRIEPV